MDILELFYHQDDKEHNMGSSLQIDQQLKQSLCTRYYFNSKKNIDCLFFKKK